MLVWAACHQHQGLMPVWVLLRTWAVTLMQKQTALMPLMLPQVVMLD
jgi:hypothetical protein